MPELAKLAVIERYSIVDDAWNAVVAGRLAAIDFVSFVSGFTHERDLAVWQAIAIGLRGCGRLLNESNYQKLNREFVRLSLQSSPNWDGRHNPAKTIYGPNCAGSLSC